jgi:hypothetical protein
MTILTLIDEAVSGPGIPAGTLIVPEPRLTGREIIRRRVFREVEAHNAGLGAGTSVSFVGLVQPAGAAARLNVQLEEQQDGTRRLVDAAEQYQAAVRAFERNGFLMFVGGRQVEELDEVVDFAGDAEEVSFLKLIALVGG